MLLGMRCDGRALFFSFVSPVSSLFAQAKILGFTLRLLIGIFGFFFLTRLASGELAG